MKRVLLLATIIFTCFTSAQVQHGYRIEGGDIIFTCNLNDYNKAVIDQTDVQLDLKDIKVNKVSISGTFNNWKASGWSLNKISDNIYELRKPISKLNTESGAAFKFVINDRFWLIPPNSANNLSPVDLNILFDEVFDLELYSTKESADGYLFKLCDYSKAEKVIVSGSFNNWDEHRFKMKRVDGCWQLRLKLNAGFHEYRFIVDGKWMEDPAALSRVLNEFGEYNSVIDQLKVIDFTLDDQNYDNVFLAGSFTNWQHQKVPMKYNNGVWELQVSLPYGAHEYKFIVDGNWILDPDNNTKQHGSGNQINSVIFVD